MSVSLKPKEFSVLSLDWFSVAMEKQMQETRFG